MENDPFRYHSWIEDALRGVIHHSLSYAAEHGLPGDHHFYITYLTDGDDVELPSYLRADHQEEMTIVLQHEFEELVVTAGMEAGLEPVIIMINDQDFTKTSNTWGVDNQTKGTNTNRIVVFSNPG